MSLHLDISPQAEARFTAAAQQKGIDPAALFEEMVTDYLPAIEQGDKQELGDFGGRTLEAWPKMPVLIR